jgi:DNA-binding response OmpR family regulator
MNDEAKRQKTIFLIEEDDETRPLLRKGLEAEGYHVIVAVDERDALDRVGGGGVPADLLLVNLVGRSLEETLELGRKVREHAKYDGHTPLVVIADKFGEDLEGTDANVAGNDWVTYPEDAGQIRALLRRLLTDKSPHKA